MSVMTYKCMFKGVLSNRILHYLKFKPAFLLSWILNIFCKKILQHTSSFRYTAKSVNFVQHAYNYIHLFTLNCIFTDWSICTQLKALDEYNVQVAIMFFVNLTPDRVKMENVCLVGFFLSTQIIKYYNHFTNFIYQRC